MNIKEKLAGLKESQQKIIREYETVIKEYESSEPVIENEKMRRQIEELTKELRRVETESRKNLQENDRLKQALQEQILDEKLQILRISRQKLETYFETQTSEYRDRLTAMEAELKNRFAELRETARRNMIPVTDEFYNHLNQLELELDAKLREQEAHFTENRQNLKEELSARLDSLAKEEVTPEIIEKRAKQNQWEMKIGLNWINRIGIILILFGMGAAFNYSYQHWMNDYLKGSCFFILGGLFLFAGEWFYRRRKEVFSTGLLGGGIAILYGSIFYSFFALKIINLEISLLLAILVTLTTVVLSLRYNSPTIGSLGLIGGYLPFLTLVLQYGNLVYSNFWAAMGYLFILNMLILLISLRKKWDHLNYLSFLLNMPSLIYLVNNIPSLWAGIAYSTITFLMYLAITLIYPLQTKTPVKAPAVILLGLNTLINCLILFSLFGKAGFTEYRGLMALIFCLVYLGLGRLVQKSINNEKGTLVLFYATALTFAVLIVPFQFGISWLSMGWLVEGILLAVYGFRVKNKGIEGAGWGIYLLCMVTFVWFDFIPAIFGITRVEYFDLKYLLITAGAILIILPYLQEITQNRLSSLSGKGRAITLYKYFTVFSVWVYLLYSGNLLFLRWVKPIVNSDFYSGVLQAVITIGLGYLITRVRLFFDKVIKGFAVFLYLLGDLICIILTISIPLLKPEYSANTPLHYLALFILLLYNIFVFGNIRILLLRFLKHKNISLEWYPLVLGCYLLGCITSFITVQLNLGNINLLFSFVYLIVAISFIIYGFSSRYIYIRRFGLGLTLFATAKLFIYDLSFLDNIGRIIAYFGFGLILLAVSFIYQKVKTSLEGAENVKKA